MSEPFSESARNEPPGCRTITLDMDGEHFKRHVRAIQDEIRALMNLYLGPRTRGLLFDLESDLNELIARRDCEG